MPKPPILARTVDEATPAVRKAAIWLAGQLSHGELYEFFACEPCLHSVHAAGRPDDPWIEGWWGALVRTPGATSLSGLARLRTETELHFEGKIELVEVDVSPAASSVLDLAFTLSARIAECSRRRPSGQVRPGGEEE
jgi:hypothetical protein